MAVMASTSTEFLHVAVTATPAGTDLSSAAARLALVTHNTVPAAGEWHAASWSGATVRLLIGADSDAPLGPGDYRVWVHVDPPGAESVVRRAGMLTVT